MQIIDLSPEHEQLYFCCLEDWSQDIKEAGLRKQKWYEFMKDKGLRVKLSVDENNLLGGMIQYLPIEQSMFKGENLYVILCIWVHGHKQGRGNYQGKGMGAELLKAAEEDVKKLNSNGLVAWGMRIPVFMRASWFKKHGYKVVKNSGMMSLMWKKFNPNANPPEFIDRIKIPEKENGKVKLDIFSSGWCPAMNMTYERALRASQDIHDFVEVNQYSTIDRTIVDEWGIQDGIYLDGKEIRTGPPPPYKKIRKKIERKVNKIKNH